ncbi:MAG: hypothetical protein J6N76_10050 [Lachnospiraceae bacterium]|nr:hypothetical protein [Lachnospiraceae bacterium]
MVALAAAADGGVDLSSVTNPIIGFLDSILGPIIALVGAVGALYCVLLGVKFAKAEEPQEREKAKAHLRNAIIGFVLIFILVVALKQLLPIMNQWMTTNMVAPAGGAAAPAAQ